MEKNKRYLLIPILAFMLSCGLVAVFNRRLGLGLIAGYATGLINYLLISFSVKRIMALSGAISGKVMLSGVFYFLRFLLAFLVIAAVLSAVKTCSFAGFLAGFSVFLGSVLMVSRVSGHARIGQGQR